MLLWRRVGSWRTFWLVKMKCKHWRVVTDRKMIGWNHLLLLFMWRLKLLFSVCWYWSLHRASASSWSWWNLENYIENWNQSRRRWKCQKFKTLRIYLERSELTGHAGSKAPPKTRNHYSLVSKIYIHLLLRTTCGWYESLYPPWD